MLRLFIEKDFESFLVFDEVLILWVWLFQMYVPRKILNHEKKFQGIDVYNPGKYVGMDKEHWTYL